MNTNVLTKLIGVFCSFIIIWLVNDFTLVDACTEQAGTFDHSTGKCLLDNGEIYKSGFETPLVVLYAFIGFFVTYFVSKLLNALFKKTFKTVNN